MTASPNLLPLKLIVIFLGLLLIGGIIFVGASIGKASKELSSPHCTQDARVHLPHNGIITNVTTQGDIANIAQMTAELPPRAEIYSVDRCSGKILQTLIIDHD